MIETVHVARCISAANQTAQQQLLETLEKRHG
jgi:hypothetical protein